MDSMMERKTYSIVSTVLQSSALNTPKSTDTGHDGDLYTTVRINRGENIAKYRLLIEDLENADIK